MKFLARPLSRKRRFWLSLALFPTVLTSLIALLSPSNILEEIPPLYALVQFWGGIIPSMRGYMTLSSFSQVTGAYFAVAWSLFPIQMAGWFMFMVENARETADVKIFSSPEYKALRGPSRTKALFLSLGLAAMAAVGLLFLPKDPSFVGGHGMNHSRFGMAFYGGLIFVIFCWSFLTFFYALIFKKKGDL